VLGDAHERELAKQRLGIEAHRRRARGGGRRLKQQRRKVLSRE
jgi:hypothetical protein